MDHNLGRLAALRESLEAYLDELRAAAGHREDGVAQLLEELAQLSRHPTLLSDEERAAISASSHSGGGSRSCSHVCHGGHVWLSASGKATNNLPVQPAPDSHMTIQWEGERTEHSF